MAKQVTKYENDGVTPAQSSYDEGSALDGAQTTPGAPMLALAAGTEPGIGLYQYAVAFVTANGETTPGTQAEITTTSGNQRVQLTNIPIGPSRTTQVGKPRRQRQG